MPVSDAVLNSFIGSADNFLSTQGDAITNVVDYLTGEGTDRFTYSRKNSEACWYDPTCSALSTLTPILIASPGQHTRALAISDSNSLVSSLFFEYRSSDLPNIYQAMNGSGGYNSTTAALLANDAFARTTAKAAKEVLDNVQRYGNIRQGDVQALAQIYASTKGSYTVGSLAGGNAGGSAGGTMGSIFDIIGNIFAT